MRSDDCYILLREEHESACSQRALARGIALRFGALHWPSCPAGGPQQHENTFAPARIPSSAVPDECISPAVKAKCSGQSAAGPDIMSWGDSAELNRSRPVTASVLTTR
jgi:hypothetical protein